MRITLTECRYVERWWGGGVQVWEKPGREELRWSCSPRSSEGFVTEASGDSQNDHKRKLKMQAGKGNPGMRDKKGGSKPFKASKDSETKLRGWGDSKWDLNTWGRSAPERREMNINWVPRWVFQDMLIYSILTTALWSRYANPLVIDEKLRLREVNNLSLSWNWEPDLLFTGSWSFYYPQGFPGRDHFALLELFCNVLRDFLLSQLGISTDT